MPVSAHVWLPCDDDDENDDGVMMVMIIIIITNDYTALSIC